MESFFVCLVIKVNDELLFVSRTQVNQNLKDALKLFKILWQKLFGKKFQGIYVKRCFKVLKDK
jgi:hypothetical protein